MKTRLIIFFSVLFVTGCYSQNSQVTIQKPASDILPGAARLSVYLPLLINKKVGVFANQTSTIGSTHLVDTLLSLGVQVKAIFSPEHGFRGNADAGQQVGNDTDAATGIPVISLYGKKTQPSAADLADIDLLIFDIQDVGVRFYTYISSLQDFMEAAFIHHKPLLLLDRPNPNGFYVDGPVLDTAHYRSFIGRQPIPVVYGMTMGEYARMIAGEGWLSPEANAVYKYYLRAPNTPPDTPFHFLVIKCENYTHSSHYDLPEKPSPNLPDMSSVYWYPSTCFFEGTALSEGRGTATPFQVFGHPALPDSLYRFTPQPTAGASHPKWSGKPCYGWNLAGSADQSLKRINGQIQLHWLLEAYRLFPDKSAFFLRPRSGKPEDYFFNKLAGTDKLMQQIIAGESEAQIRASWKQDLNAFLAVRKKYLLYPDFSHE